MFPDLIISVYIQYFTSAEIYYPKASLNLSVIVMKSSVYIKGW